MERIGSRATCVALALVAVGALPSLARGQGAAPAAGDPAAGRALFVGERPFSAGGPPCGACHGVGGQGFGLGAAFGPDLTGAVDAFGGPEQVDALLETLPFPSMEPLYAGKALTPGERADLGAFLVATGGHAPASEQGAFALHAGLLGAALLVAVALGGRGRGASTRDRLVAAARRRRAPFTQGGKP
jgi:mono/diheme cytochrome c family protein